MLVTTFVATQDVVEEPDDVSDAVDGVLEGLASVGVGVGVAGAVGTRSLPIVMMGQPGIGGATGGGYIPGATPKPATSKPPAPHPNQQCQKNGSTVWCP